jgi:thioredoxin 1
MKKWFLLLCLAFTLNLSAENIKDLDSPALQIIYDNFLNENNDIFLKQLAQHIIDQENSQIEAEDLIGGFKELANDPVIAEAFKLMIAEFFETQEDIENAATLIQTEFYQKYNPNITMANLFCQLKAMETFQLLVKQVAAQQKILNEKTKVGQIVELTPANHQALLKANDYVIVNIYTERCSACKYMDPIFIDMNQEYGSKYCFAKLQADEQLALARAYQIQGFPTILFIKKGVVVGQELGFMNKEKFAAKIQTYFE